MSWRSDVCIYYFHVVTFYLRKSNQIYVGTHGGKHTVWAHAENAQNPSAACAGTVPKSVVDIFAAVSVAPVGRWVVQETSKIQFGFYEVFYGVRPLCAGPLWFQLNENCIQMNTDLWNGCTNFGCIGVCEMRAVILWRRSEVGCCMNVFHL